MTLSEQEKFDYLNEHIPYRLNSLRAWDLYITKRRSNSYEEESDDRKCNWESHYLDPAFEISIIFGRSLLQFLGLTCRNNSLEYFVSKMGEDVQIWDVVLGKPPYPLSELTAYEKEHLCNIIKVANKASAHLTRKYSTTEELNSLAPGRKLIYKMVTSYVDGLDKSKLWWELEIKNHGG